MSERFPLTPQMRRCLDFIRAYNSEHGRGPSFRDIADGLNLRSKSNVTRLLRSLEERGHIKRLPGRARAIALADEDATGGGFLLPPAVRQQLECYCRVTGESPSDVVATAVALHLDELGPRVPAADVQALLRQA